jgi:hypothetical protein
MYLFKAWHDAVVVAACTAFILAQQEESVENHGQQILQHVSGWTMFCTSMYRTDEEESTETVGGAETQ